MVGIIDQFQCSGIEARYQTVRTRLSQLCALRAFVVNFDESREDTMTKQVALTIDGQTISAQEGMSVLDAALANAALDMLGLDTLGLDQGDRKILKVIVDLFNGGPVGLSTIAAALNEEQQTIEDIYEPYLIQKGLLERTPRGRKATFSTYEYLGREWPSENNLQFTFPDEDRP